MRRKTKRLSILLSGAFLLQSGACTAADVQAEFASAISGAIVSLFSSGLSAALDSFFGVN